MVVFPASFFSALVNPCHYLRSVGLDHHFVRIVLALLHRILDEITYMSGTVILLYICHCHCVLWV